MISGAARPGELRAALRRASPGAGPVP